ncbi:uncharacterized protein AMSG_03709 [Thecamonas trahens ATCC 50062]|uniref:Uncharacterized protein n=1 Tax=Thecamonas trahens ATCC 50062 TaxID=461836 RepID=A0A0L0D4N4_THETB|nr:hypothetical protein AMSG_03709 [Thecamonas trahens ATCC 50062]KNC47279.1 hypothetical protein AMSG_03709 [Thecamonas trahens ATCC 50062]|eukprot:XP_013759622.1 hypothetical protein AMSG_03709 [Thecamonas trahens ATCC 50062]
MHHNLVADIFAAADEDDPAWMALAMEMAAIGVQTPAMGAYGRPLAAWRQRLGQPRRTRGILAWAIDGRLDRLVAALVDSGTTPTTAHLEQACKIGAVAVVRVLLAADVDARPGLLSAALAGQASAVGACLDSCPTASFGKTLELALLSAAKSGHAAVVSKLLESGVDAAADRASALFFACRSGHSDVVELLLQSPTLSAEVEGGQALVVACGMRGSSSTIDKLLDAGEFTPETIQVAAIEAAKHGHREAVVRLLSRPGIRTAELVNDVLMAAVDGSHSAIVALMLDEPGVAPGADESEALRRAAWLGDVETVRLLLASGGVDVSARNNAALQNSTKRGNVELVRLLLANGADATVRDCDPFTTACAQGHLEAAQELLACDGVTASVHGNTAIEWAAGNGRKDVVTFLLTQPEVDPSVRNHAPLRVAVFNGHTAIVERLLAHHRGSKCRRWLPMPKLVQLASEAGNSEMLATLEVHRAGGGESSSSPR